MIYNFEPSNNILWVIWLNLFERAHIVEKKLKGYLRPQLFKLQISIFSQDDDAKDDEPHGLHAGQYPGVDADFQFKIVSNY